MNNLSANKKLIILLPLAIIVGIIIVGISLGILYSLLPANNPQRSKQGCESVGGQWSNERNFCLLSYKNPGDVCTDGGQCKSGVCFPPLLTEEQKINLTNGPIKNIVGNCYPDELITGCVKQVLMGTISKESMCLD
jgi:hypothetical protein